MKNRFYILILLLAACSKNEHPVDDIPFTKLAIRTYSVDALRLKLVVDGEVLTDSLVTPNGVRDKDLVRYPDPKHRFQLFDAFTDRLYLDTMVEYHGGVNNYISFHQEVAGGDFRWIGPPANESAPPVAWAKISFRHTIASLPDPVKVVVENSVNAVSYVATDSFDIHRNEYSKYFLAYYGNNRRVQLKFYNPGSRTYLAFLGTSGFASLFTGFNIFLLPRREANTPAGQPFEIYADKLY